MARSHVYIVGAGFSKHAGLPLQKDFTEALLEPRADEYHPMRPLVEHLGCRLEASRSVLPEAGHQK